MGRGTNVRAEGQEEARAGVGRAALLQRAGARCLHLARVYPASPGRRKELGTMRAGQSALKHSAPGCQQHTCRGRAWVAGMEQWRLLVCCAVHWWGRAWAPAIRALLTIVCAGWNMLPATIDILHGGVRPPAAHLLVPSSWEREERGGARPEPGMATGAVDTALASELSSWSFTGSSTSPAH